MRAAIYARYSSDLQSESSIDDQLRDCRTHVTANGWQIVEEYTDAAISGSSVLRPGYQAMLADARTGRFDVLVAEALDRLSRDQEDIAGLYKQLNFCGVRLLTLSEGEVNELHIGLKCTMNALFLKDLATKIKRGQRGCIEDGRSPGGLSYGYRVRMEYDDKGLPIRGLREVDEHAAAVIQRIYEDYTNGKSPRSIAMALNQAGIPSPKGGKWNASTINGNKARRNGILQNEAYLGLLIYNRTSMLRDPSTGRRVHRLNPVSD